jgi:two-component system, NarL family, nitrate/nitrite response regulator NarL
MQVEKGRDKMLNVLLYTTQPMLALGLAATLRDGNCHLASICSTTPSLLEALTQDRFDVLLVEVTPDIDTEMLSGIKDAAQGAPIVIWVDAVSTEFVAKAFSLGVRGILRRNLPLELQVRCLEKVGSGELWIEKELVASLLSNRRIVFTPGERRLAILMSQGLKNKEIGYRLGLTEGTVKVYLSRLFQKVGVSDRFELALFVIGHLFGGRSYPAEPEVPVLPVASARLVPGAILTPGAGLAHHRLSTL